ncbi:MAG: L,D-transpeptidase family protein [Armatimonadetes bacterium]|nr:L,D-transpeptidase family protein [Armatimonadota bacterium]
MSFSKWVASLTLLAASFGAVADSLPGVTFASKPGQMYAPLRALAAAFGLEVTYDAEKRMVGLGEVSLPETEFTTLFDGTKLFDVSKLGEIGAVVTKDKDAFKVDYMGKEYVFAEGTKRVEVSIEEQLLRAWQGDILVMETNISSGRSGHSTPRGNFAARTKARMHYSRLYDNAPMPWSVQVNGDIFIHGYRSVPRYPASHGCIRMPLHGKNAARWFYEWVDLGTPVSIQHDFSAKSDKGQSGQ